MNRFQRFCLRWLFKKLVKQGYSTYNTSEVFKELIAAHQNHYKENSLREIGLNMEDTLKRTIQLVEIDEKLAKIPNTFIQII